MKKISKKFKIYSLASGSKGNCLLVEAGDTRVLVDVGISYRKLLDKLEHLHVSIADLDGIFITHEHVDHVSGLPVLMKNTDVNVFARENTWKQMKFWRDLRKNYCRRLPEHLLINGLQVDVFGISHDAVEPVGFNFYYNNHKCSVITDMGFPSLAVKEKIKNADLIVLEANHDLEMLRTGMYPQVLQQRIRGTKGHLSNEDAGWLLNNVVEGKGVKVLLAHLSQENNTPQIALDTVKNILKQNGKLHNVNLQVASQEKTIFL